MMHTFKVITAYECLKQACVECQLRTPERITDTVIRKHVATLAQEAQDISLENQLQDVEFAKATMEIDDSVAESQEEEYVPVKAETMEPKTDQPPSLVLTTALDKIGANHCMRMKYRERNALQLVGYEFQWINEDGISFLTERRVQEKFGSFIEGTTTPGLKSDRDDVFIEASVVLEEGCEVSSMIDGKTVIVVTDMFTPPGFVKLKAGRILNFNSFKLMAVENGELFLTNVYTDEYLRDLRKLVQFAETLEKNGPALTHYFKEGRLESVDIIGALRSKSIMSFSQEFFNRKRRYGWPDKHTLPRMKEQGCLFVPTGHRQCEERFCLLQWRISFSFQERHLMLNLNDTQYKCYILLKLLKKSHISPIVGLTSYHCKTSLFYTIENSTEDMWRNENLYDCFIYCLKRLKEWSMNQFCPSYFIPEVNLFTGKMDDQELKKLTNILTNIIENTRYYIHEISTDDFGTLVKLYEAHSDDNAYIMVKANLVAAAEFQLFLLEISSLFFRVRTTILWKITYRCKTVTAAIHKHLKWINTLQNLQLQNKVAHIQLDDIGWVLPHLSKFLHASLASHLALNALETKDPILKSLRVLAAAFHFYKGLGSDATSGKMKLTAVLFYNGNIGVDHLKSQYRHFAEARPICDCRFKREDTRPFCDAINELYMQSPKEVMRMCTSSFIEKYISACTIFLPTEARLTPYPLKFEMYRGFGSALYPQEEYFGNVNKMSCVDLGLCAAIDSKAFCLLMAALLSNAEERKVFIDLLASIAENLSHQETTLNLLGWLASAGEIDPKLLLFYKQSWDYHVKLKRRTTPFRKTTDRNAAKWHLALLLYRAWMFYVNNADTTLQIID